MKKHIFTLAFFTCLFTASFASSKTSSYKVDDVAVDQLFASSTDVTFSAEGVNALNVSTTAGGGTTVGGFLLRNFFCGFIALHRKYMGGDWNQLWWKYFCIPIAGGVASLGDFLYVLIGGQDALDKYDGNDKWFVWLE